MEGRREEEERNERRTGDNDCLGSPEVELGLQSSESRKVEF